MSVKSTIDQTLQKPMSRRDFLSHVGALLLAVIGITSILHSLGLHDDAPRPHTARSGSAPKAQSGYGSSSYGV